MGSLVLPVKNLLAEPQLVTDQWFHLDGALPKSQLLLRAELKVSDFGPSSLFSQASARTHVVYCLSHRFLIPKCWT